MDKYEKERDLDNDWELVRCTATGERATRVTTVQLKPEQVAVLRKRFDVLKALQEPGFVRMIELHEQDGVVQIIFEDLTCLTPISQLLQNYRENNQFQQEAQLCSILKQILVLIHKLHERGIAHLGIDPESIYLDGSNSVKMGLFDVFQRRQQSIYASPEYLISKQRSAKSDIFAVGCLLFEFSALKPPFLLAEKVDSMMFASVPDFPSFYSAEFCKLLRRMLQRDAKLRPSAGTLLATSLMAKASINEVSYCQGSPQTQQQLQTRTRMQLTDTSSLGIRDLYRYLLANDDDLETRVQSVRARMEVLLGTERYEAYTRAIAEQIDAQRELDLPNCENRGLIIDIFALLETVSRTTQ